MKVNKGRMIQCMLSAIYSVSFPERPSVDGVLSNTQKLYRHSQKFRKNLTHLWFIRKLQQWSDKMDGLIRNVIDIVAAQVSTVAY